MRNINKIIIFIFVIFIAKLIADQVVRDNFIFVLIVFAAFFYMLYSSWNQKFTLLSLTVFIPFVFPAGIQLPLEKWIEVLAPLFAFILYFEILSHKQTPFPKKSALFLAAVAVLGLWSAVNYIKNPVLGSIAFGVDYMGGGIRSYYLIFIGITTFLCSLWFFTYKELNVQRWLWILIIICLIIGDLRIIGYFQNFQIPFIGGTFKYGMYRQIERMLRYKEISGLQVQVGIGGLREMAALGISLVVSIIYYGNWNIYSVLALINSLAFVILGGGRSNFMGAVLAISSFIILFKRRYLWPVILLLLIFIPLFFLSDLTISESKFGRAFVFKGGIEKQSSDRYYTFLYMWKVFKESPIFGKGIGYVKVNLRDIISGPADTASEKILTQIIQGRLSGTGGHGAYLSIISVFGIGGIFFIAVMLFGGIYYAYRIIRERSDISDDVQLALFAFLYLIILALTFVAGGNGYDSVELWFLSGMIAGLKAKERLKNVATQ
jgi:hypothetical protein